MAMKRHKNGFTLIELLVVVGMIAIILGAITTSVAAAQNRARIQKATSDVKVITQAILAYENYAKNQNIDLPALGGYGVNGTDIDGSSLGFLLGDGGTTLSGEKLPILLMAALQGGTTLRDPWGTPYKVHIAEGNLSVTPDVATDNMKTWYHLPNFYRLGKEEREL